MESSSSASPAGAKAPHTHTHILAQRGDSECARALHSSRWSSHQFPIYQSRAKSRRPVCGAFGEIYQKMLLAATFPLVLCLTCGILTAESVSKVCIVWLAS